MVQANLGRTRPTRPLKTGSSFCSPEFPTGLKVASGGAPFLFSARRPPESGGPTIISSMNAPCKRPRSNDQLPNDEVRLDQIEQAPHVPPISFKDMLQSSAIFEKPIGASSAAVMEDQLVIQDGDFEVSESANGPSICFSEQVKEKLYRPWRNSIIIKFVGRAHTYNFVLARLKQRWQLKGPMQLIDLSNDFFIVRFLLEEDLNYVLTGGPWVIAGQYLTMQKWRPNFDPDLEQISRLTIWARLSGLYVEYFTKETVKPIGDLLGTIHKVDCHTIAQSRGKYARVCVEIVTSKPLKPFLIVEGKQVRVEYENLPLICFKCGRIGHSKDHCVDDVIPMDTRAQQVDDKSNNSTEEVNGGLPANPSANEGRVGHLNLQDHEQGNLMDSSDGASVGFGPWNMVVGRKGSKKVVSNDNGKKIQGKPSVIQVTKGSRFDILRQNDAGTVKEVSNDARNEPIASETIFGNHDLRQGLGIQLDSSTKEAHDAKEKHAIANGKKKIGRPKKTLNNITNSKVNAAQNGDVLGPKTKPHEAGVAVFKTHRLKSRVSYKLPVPDLHHHTYVHANNNEEGNSANVSSMNMQVVVPNVDSSLTFGHQPPNISSSAGIRNPKEDEGVISTNNFTNAGRASSEGDICSMVPETCSESRPIVYIPNGDETSCHTFSQTGEVVGLN